MTPAPTIGLRIGRRVSGEPFLHGIAAKAFTVPAGARVQLRRLHPDGDGTATHVIVFAPPDPRTGKDALTEACVDGAWWRNDTRDGDGQEAPW